MGTKRAIEELSEWMFLNMCVRACVRVYRWLRFLSARHAVHRHCETNVSERFIFCLQQNTRTTSFSNASMPGQALTHIERTQLSSSSQSIFLYSSAQSVFFLLPFSSTMIFSDFVK